jgi:molybdopterin converting factor subunit 1
LALWRFGGYPAAVDCELGGLGERLKLKLTLLYFAHLAERAGAREESREVADGINAGGLRALVEQAHPKLAGALATCRVAVDEEFAADDTPLRDGQTVAFIPPVSGG